MFKTKKYLNNRKVAEAVNRILSNSVDPLFYLSSFQTLSRNPPVPGHSRRGVFLPSGNDWVDLGHFLDISFGSSIIKADHKQIRSAFHVL